MSISSKLTLYDFLCMMVSGILILWPFCNCMLREELECVFFFVLCYLMGIVYHKIVEQLMRPLRNVSCMIEKGRQIATNRFLMKTKRNAPEQKVDYYEAYYFLIRNNSLNVIPVLEAQVAFIKSIYPILLIYTISLLANCVNLDWLTTCRCQFATILAVLIITLPFVWYTLQMKIFEFVWEGYFFIHNSIKSAENEEDTY